jgi:hypothetical protein
MSGLYDLQPIRLSYLNEKLDLTRQRLRLIARKYTSEPRDRRNAPLTSFNFMPDFSVPQISGARDDEVVVTPPSISTWCRY